MYTIYLTTECNFSCKYCYEDYNCSQTIHLENLVEIIDNIMQLEKKKVLISFMGGEPLLKKELIYIIVDYIKKEYSDRECVYFITTNCSLIDDEFIKFATNNNFRVRASFDGTEKSHNLNRIAKNGKNYYPKILSNIVKMKDQGIHLEVRGTITASSIKYFSENIKYLNEMGFSNICFIPDINITLDEDVKILLESELNKACDYYIAQCKAGKKFVLDLFDGHFINMMIELDSKFSMCGAGLTSFTFMPNKDIYPCSYVIENEEFLIGNTSIQVNEEKNHSIIYKNCSLSKNKCTNCKIKTFCLGMKCGYLNYIKTGYINTPSELLCFQEKVLYKNVSNILGFFLEQKNDFLNFLKPTFEFLISRGYKLNECGKKLGEKI